MTLNYGWENLYRAMLSLCGKATQSERLTYALSALTRIDPENDLPESMKSEFQEFMDEMTSVDAKSNEGKIAATVNSFDESNVEKSVEKIIGFFDRVCRHRDPS